MPDGSPIWMASSRTPGRTSMWRPEPCADAEAHAASPLLSEVIARTPLEQFVIWDGSATRIRANSLPCQALQCVTERWKPISLRQIVWQTAAAAALTPQKAERIRDAVRAHQFARPTAYFLVRRTSSGDYRAVTDIPWPANAEGPIRSDEIILHACGRRFGGPAQVETVTL